MKKFLFIFIVILFWITGYSQTQQEPYRRIGYTTNYGYGFQHSKNVSTILYHNSYTNTNSRIYCPGAFDVSNSGPRKSPEHPNPSDPPTYNPFSSAFWKWYSSEEGQDWIRINGSPWGIISDPDENWPSYVTDDYWDEFLSAYPEYENEARRWYESRGMRFPGDPDDPFLTPIGDVPFMLIIGLTLIYILCKANLGDRLSGVRAFNRLKRL